MHAVRRYFRFAHVDGPIGSDPAVYARLPNINRGESRTQGLDRLELIRFLQVVQTSPSTTARWPTCSASTPLQAVGTVLGGLLGHGSVR